MEAWHRAGTALEKLRGVCVCVCVLGEAVTYNLSHISRLGDNVIVYFLHPLCVIIFNHCEGTDS